MTYLAGQTIKDDEYNLFNYGNANGATVNDNVPNVQRLWGGNPNFLDRGYGQSGALSSVSPGNTVTATSWTNLLNRINTIAAHQNTSVTAITNPSAGNTITAYTALQNNITDIWNNRLNCDVVNADYTIHTRTTGWTNSVTFTQTLTFSSESNLYDFFNCGGMIDLNPNRAGGTVSDKNTSWTNLCNEFGHLYVTSDAANKDIGVYTSKPGCFMVAELRTPSTLNTAVGVFQLTTSNVLLAQLYADEANYTSNHIAMYGKKNANVVTITTVMTDVAADSGGAEDIVDGTLQVDLGLWSPDTTYLSNSWGSVTVAGSQTGS